MRSLALLMLAASLGAPAAPQPSPHTRTFEVPPTGQVQLFSVACEPGEELIGGGYAAAGTAIRVVGSYPSGGVWSVQALNAGKVPVTLQVEVNCLTGVSGMATVVEVKGETPKVAVQCPEGTVVTGGGYQTGTRSAYVTGSHPMGDNGWGIEAQTLPGVSAVPGTQQVFGICLKGAQIASADLDTLQRGTFTGSCAAGEVLASLGYEVSDGSLPPYAVQKASTNELSFNADAPVTLQVTTLCLSWPEPVQAGAGWPLLAGIGLVVLILIAAVIVLSYRTRARRLRGAQYEVVVRSVQGRFGLDQLREVQ